VTAVVADHFGRVLGPGEGYKLPTAFIFVDQIVRSPAGKAGYRWAKDLADGESSHV
jgi:hypothetical protein